MARGILNHDLFQAIELALVGNGTSRPAMVWETDRIEQVEEEPRAELIAIQAALSHR